jgi:hypothetical protein
VALANGRLEAADFLLEKLRERQMTYGASFSDGLYAEAVQFGGTKSLEWIDSKQEVRLSKS